MKHVKLKESDVHQAPPVYLKLTAYLLRDPLEVGASMEQTRQRSGETAYSHKDANSSQTVQTGNIRKDTHEEMGRTSST